MNGQEEIEVLADGSRWMLRAKEATYGYSVSCGAADEAWKVRESSIEEGLTPTMAERSQPQLLLVSAMQIHSADAYEMVKDAPVFADVAPKSGR